MDNNKGLIISVGAGYPQTPFIKRLKEGGYKVAAFGMGRNDKTAIELCDYFKVIDTSDASSAIEWLESIGEKPIGAGSFAGGVAIETLQKIERHFNLPTQIQEFLTVGMNKHTQQRLYNNLELSNIRTFYISELKKHTSDLSVDKDYILKPVIGRGSAGVFKFSGGDLKAQLETNQFNDEDLVQECINGEEYRLMVIIQKGECQLLAQVKRESLDKTFLLGRLTIVETHQKKLEKYINHLIKATKIVNAIIKLDVIINDECINMIEMDIGVGGGLYFKKFVEHAYGIDIIDEYINLITNKDLSFKELISVKDIKMDYIYNYSKKPIEYNLEKISNALYEKIGHHQIVENLLNSGNSGQFETNADFIFTIIHNAQGVSTIELNQFVNNFFIN